MTLVWIVLSAFIIGWGTNIGAFMIGLENRRDRIIYGAIQSVLIVLGLVVFYLGT